MPDMLLVDRTLVGVLDVVLTVLIVPEVLVVPDELPVGWGVLVEADPFAGLLGGKLRSETPARHASATVMVIATFIIFAMPTWLELSCTRRQMSDPSI